MTTTQLILIAAVAVLSNLYGASVGGAGLILLPVLIFTGMDAQSAAATSIVGFLGMGIAGSLTYHKAKAVDFHIAIPAALIAAIGSVMGSFILLNIPNHILKSAIGIFILIILCIVLIQPNFGLEKRKKSNVMNGIGYALLFPLGIQSIVIPAGGSILTTYIFLFFFGKTFIESAAARMVVFLVIDLVAVAILSYAHVIDWTVGLLLVFSMGLGTWLGARYALNKGNKWIRQLFILVVVVSAIRLLM